MKKRWREDELLLATILTSIGLSGYLWQMYILSPERKASYAAPFYQDAATFSYFKHILLLQVGPLLALYFSWCWINFFTIPGILKPATKDPVSKYAWVALQLLIITFV